MTCHALFNMYGRSFGTRYWSKHWKVMSNIPANMYEFWTLLFWQYSVMEANSANTSLIPIVKYCYNYALFKCRNTLASSIHTIHHYFWELRLGRGLLNCCCTKLHVVVSFVLIAFCMQMVYKSYDVSALLILSADNMGWVWLSEHWPHLVTLYHQHHWDSSGSSILQNCAMTKKSYRDSKGLYQTSEKDRRLLPGEVSLDQKIYINSCFWQKCS